jgi:hypothetical protein
MQSYYQGWFTIFAVVLFIYAICLGNYPQHQLASAGLSLAGAITLIAVAIIEKKK